MNSARRAPTFVSTLCGLSWVAFVNLLALPVSASDQDLAEVGLKVSGTQDEYVRVSLIGTLGPMGYLATPSLSSATQLAGVNPQAVLASKASNFPSIILYISAMPVVYTSNTDPTKENSVQETDRYPKWLDATFILKFFEDSDGKTRVGGDPCSDGRVQFLGLLPQQTVGGTQTQLLANAANAANSIGGALASFYPSVQPQVASATTALNVLFQNLFPPKPFAYQYSYIDSSCKFGWYFRPNDSAANGSSTVGQTSILGTQTGIVLLKTDTKIKRIDVDGLTLSEWNKAATKDGKFYKTTNPGFAKLTLPSEIDSAQISDLSAFPSLIKREQAMNILHEKDIDDNWKKVKSTANLVATPSGEYVTNASLAAFLTSKSNDLKAVQKPTLTSPSDKTQTSETSPKFTWEAAKGTAGYIVYLEKDNNPPKTVGYVDGTNYTAQNLPTGVYYWKVSSRDPNNNNAEVPSEVRTFTITTK